ncbi:hypothetical protein N5K55_02595 (plasmid) [Pseudomonas aeruginosa]|nr:hypothetical protein [Pseudomonas aeruginosa]
MYANELPRTIEEECRELIPTLDKSLKELAFLLEKSKAHIRIDALFQVPLRKSPRVDKNAAIEIVVPDGEEGIALAIETLTTIWLKGGAKCEGNASLSWRHWAAPFGFGTNPRHQ